MAPDTEFRKRPGPGPQRVIVALVSALLAGGAGWVVLGWLEKEAPTVEFSDGGATVAELFASRRAGGAPESVEGGPAELGLDFARRLSAEIDEDVATAFFGALRRGKSDWVPGVFYRSRPNQNTRRRFEEHPKGGYRRRTNSLGLRSDEEVRSDSPGARVLVMGDSHIAGVLANAESVPSMLAQRLTAAAPDVDLEVLNVAQGGYEPAHYAGTFATYGGLEPDVLVLIVFGGNDFRGTLGLWRYLYRQPSGAPVAYDVEALQAREPDGPGLLGQEVNQAAYFLANPGEEQIASELTAGVVLELVRQGAERGCTTLCVYLPPPSRAQPEIFGASLEDAMRAIGADPGGLAASDRIADRMLASLAEHEVPCVDLRPIFRAVDEPLFWKTDLHLNVTGSERTAAAIADAW